MDPTRKTAVVAGVFFIVAVGRLPAPERRGAPHFGLAGLCALLQHLR